MLQAYLGKTEGGLKRRPRRPQKGELMYSFPDFVQFLVSGVAVGCIYGLAGVGLVGIYNASRVINFAQGTFVMMGGMLTYVPRDLQNFRWCAAAIALPPPVESRHAAWRWTFFRPPVTPEECAHLQYGFWRRSALASPTDNAVRTCSATGRTTSRFSLVAKPITFSRRIARSQLSAHRRLPPHHYPSLLHRAVQVFAGKGKAMRASAINGEATSLLGVSY